MRKNIASIIKKEFYRFFKDYRLVFKTLILPALIFYLLFTVLAPWLVENFEDTEETTFKCYAQNAPETFREVFDALGFEVTETADAEAAKAQVVDKNADLLVIFPEDLDRMLLEPGDRVPNIQVYFNSSEDNSQLANDLFLAAAEQLENSLVNLMDINRDVENPDLATEKDLFAAFLGPSLSMMIMITLVTCCTNFATESIAGEKERGTIATLLATPINRSAIAIGKILSLSVFALLATVSEFAGIVLSLVQLDGASLGGMLGLSHYGSILAVAVSTVLLFVALLSVVSAHAKSVKEATSVAAFLLVFTMVPNMLPNLSENLSAMGWRFFPVLNSILCLNDIFAFSFCATDVVICCLSNVVYMLVLVLILTKMFGSEKIMFNK